MRITFNYGVSQSTAYSAAIAMPILLSEHEWDDRWNTDPTATEDHCQPEPFETLHRWQCQLETGWRRTFLFGGLWLKIEEYQCTEDCILRHETHGCMPASSFFIRGILKNCHHGLTDETVERPGYHYLEGIQGGTESDHFSADETVSRVRFGLGSEVIQRFENCSMMPRELESWVHEQSPRSFYRQGLTTPDMQLVLHQILHCPYQGAMKHLYLEGKVLELAALQFAQFADEDQARSPSLKTDDVERLHQAKAILIEQANNPPSILELARRVGLNDFKLKQGFRQVFGTTVFGCLRDYRLEHARLLLAEQQFTVQQVAHAVGYEHTGYFAKAFKQKFGVNPKTYQMGMISALPAFSKRSVECSK